MNAYEEEVKAVYEGLVLRPLTDIEVADIALTLRQFAAFLIDCAMDAELMERLGLKREGEGRAAPRVVNSTTQNGGEPLREPLPTKADPPTAIVSKSSIAKQSFGGLGCLAEQLLHHLDRQRVLV